MNEQNKYIAYLRVSTNKQGQSGLGLDAQREMISSYINSNGINRQVPEYLEVESGKNNNRPKLQEALDYCKQNQAVLIIAKLDRLARSVYFISGLMESGVEFIALDNPHANKLMLHLLAAFAEHEREQISQRTKAALQAAKVKGTKLGKNGKALAYKNKHKVKYQAELLRPHIERIQRKGITTYRGIADALNKAGIKSNNGLWNSGRVWRVLN